MLDQLYAVIDVETTGKGILGNRITEICVVLLKGNTQVDKFTSFVNPEQPIPAFITELTGIDDSMVCNAPKFHEIADRIIEITSKAIFVAHNVSFDYNVVRNEFKNIGQDFVRRKLCTVKLSRKVIPDLPSYSLGKLCHSLNIPLIGRHRAEGDTDATVILLKYIFNIDKEFKVINSFLNTKSNKELHLPKHIDKTKIDALPEQIGLYFFKNENDKIIYIGKGKNIKKSVTNYFYEIKEKQPPFTSLIHSIDYTITSTELIASLIEIEQQQTSIPEFNKALKKPVIPYQIIKYTNRKGIFQLGIDKLKVTTHTTNIKYTKSTILEQLDRLCTAYKLCPRYCNLQLTLNECENTKVKKCKGICIDQESVALYNIRVNESLDSITSKKDTYVIRGVGRDEDELSFVLVKEGVFMGYGYFPSTAQMYTVDDFETYIKPQTHSYYTTKIIQNYVKKQGATSLVYLSV